MIFYLPYLLTLFFIILLFIIYKNNLLFYSLSIAYPIVVCLLSINYNASNVFTLLNQAFSINLNSDNQLIANAFSVIVVVANGYCITQKDKLSIIFGGFYFVFSLICLYTEELIIFFIFLELMTLSACILIVLNKNNDSLSIIKKYFITHFISATFILISVVYIYSISSNITISYFRNIILHESYNIISYFLLISCIINVAAFPFSFWMVNAYPKTSGGSFIYLITFTTKISIIMFIKLFYGIEFLKYIGIVTAIYACIYSFIEDNIKRVLCYYIISQFGVIISIASGYNTEAYHILIKYIANHILYGGLLGLLIVILCDRLRINNFSEIKKINKATLLLIFIFLMYTNFPFTTNFIYKSYLYSLIGEDIIVKATIMLTTFLNILAIPISLYIKSENVKTFNLNRVLKLNIYCIILVLLAINFLAVRNYLNYISNTQSSMLEMLKPMLLQIGIIVIGLLINIILPNIKYENFKLIKFNFYNFIINHLSSLKKNEANKNENIDLSIFISDIILSVDKLILKSYNSIAIVFSLVSLIVILFIFI